MTQDLMRYDLMLQEAMRSLVRKALRRACTPEGLPGQHHFYLSFLTRAAGVEVADYLKEQYPEEMTIVLEHQYWDLEVQDDHFEVTLKFKDVPQHLVIPYSAMTRFFDPSVNFGLPLKPDHSAQQVELFPAGETNQEASNGKTKSAAETKPDPKEKPKNENNKDKDGETDEKMGEVVSLDSFRKK